MKIIPDKLLIVREEDEHAFHTGRISDRYQFWGYNTFAFESGAIGIPQNWENLRKEYIVLNLFDVEDNIYQLSFGTMDLRAN
ncbi:hypothetical protein ACFP1I_13205 [Dyadobacter subterraneus]|uniref:Uncharacterized protein n=1 Tax=Dyadobacter subterraneus TaxID=2773304 RepID=A0ABR9W9R1_9BACT|nr:hypothetical protein [Dyadobacter subterraneus]MBE9462190.1 hypothetical protein [Dyadobacter subterraneus]